MGKAREKYPSNCPWDHGPNQKQALRDEWILVNGDQYVKFSKNEHDENWFNINKMMRCLSSFFLIKRD